MRLHNVHQQLPRNLVSNKLSHFGKEWTIYQVGRFFETQCCAAWA